MDAIRQWLAGKKEYTAGVALYMEYGDDALVKKMFREERSLFKAEYLEKALTSLVATIPGDSVTLTTQHTFGPATGQAVIPPYKGTIEMKAAVTKESVVTMPKTPGVKNTVKVKVDTTKALKKIEEVESNMQNAICETRDSIDDLKYDVDSLGDNVSELATDVRKIDAIESEVSTIKEDVRKLKSEAKRAPRGWPPQMDDYVKSLHAEWLPLFSEKKSLQQRLPDIAFDGEHDKKKANEACDMALRILKLRDMIRKIYERRDHYMSQGTILEEPTLIDIPRDQKQWPLTLQNWQRYVRDYKNKLKTLPDKLARALDKPKITEEKKQAIIDDFAQKATGFKKQLEKYEWGVSELKKLMEIDDAV